MVCYRRFGHNEGDEPSFTQTLMYKKIKNHPSTLEIYDQKLIKEGLVTKEEIEISKKKFKDFISQKPTFIRRKTEEILY